MSDNLTLQEQIDLDKEQKIMETVAWRCAYYRANPNRYISDVLNISLKPFQKIIIHEMFQNNFTMYLAARGQGKTFLTALFCCVLCVLYPRSFIVVSSGTLKQANEVLLKIQDMFMRDSIILASEIEFCHVGQNDATIQFRNGSWIKTRTSSPNSRSARATCIIVDEFRMVDKDVLDTVLRRFLADPRHPKYLDKKEYAYLQERNKEIYLSSCWMKSHWSWDKAKDFTIGLLDDTKKYFITGLPYQASVKEGLLNISAIEDEMEETSFNPLSWQMEMDCLWFGDIDGSLFKFDEISKRRKIKNAFMPLKFYNDRTPVPPLSDTEERVMSVDVALMASTKKKQNDASSIFINSAIQTDDVSYNSHFVFADSFEGLTTDELGIIVMRYFYKYKCTQLVLDTNGIGLGVYDFICKDQYDSETGETYPALMCVNDPDMAVRCKAKDAKKVVWSVKATSSFNNEICVLLRNGIQNGKIDFLIPEQNVDEVLKDNIKGFSKMSIHDQSMLQLPYIQTTMAVYELIKLDHEVKNGQIKVKEISGMRKDRYSSIAYNFWCTCQLELKLKPKNQSTNDLINKLPIRQSKRFSLYN